MLRRLVLPLLFLIKSSLFGYNYDWVLLKAQANIYPKLIVLDNNVEEKLINNTVILTILYDPSDHQKAKELKEYINSLFHHKLQRFSFDVKLKEFSKLDEQTQATAFYALKAPPKDIKHAISIAQKKHLILFSYDLEDLKKGALISLYIDNQSTIYINNRVSKLYGIDFSDIFYTIARFKDD